MVDQKWFRIIYKKIQLCNLLTHTNIFQWMGKNYETMLKTFLSVLSLFLYLWFEGEQKSHGFGTTWGVSNSIIEFCIFWWTNPLNESISHSIKTNTNRRSLNLSLFCRSMFHFCLWWKKRYVTITKKHYLVCLLVWKKSSTSSWWYNKLLSQKSPHNITPFQGCSYLYPFHKQANIVDTKVFD